MPSMVITALERKSLNAMASLILMKAAADESDERADERLVDGMIEDGLGEGRPAGRDIRSYGIRAMATLV